MKKLLLFFCLLTGFQVNAQTGDLPFALGIIGGLTQYNGDLGNAFYASGQASYMHAGLSTAWYISPRWDVAANFTFGSIGYRENAFSRFRGNQTQLNTHFRFNILNQDNHKVIPYLHAGIGFAYYEKHSVRPGMDV